MPRATVRNQSRVGAVCLALALMLGAPCACLAAETSSTVSRAAPLKARFYYVPGCTGCKKAQAAVKSAQEHFGSRVEIDWLDLNKNPAAFDRFLDELDAHGIKITPKLIVFVGDTYLAGESQIVDALQSTLKTQLSSASPPAAHPSSEQPPVAAPASAAAVDRTTLAGVALFAIGDGFNPCAFATVILFVSMLCAVGRSRREILLTGIAFITAVFLAYFAIGLAFFRVMKWLEGVHVLSEAVAWIAFGLVVVAGVLSLIDAVRAMRGKTGGMILVLPEHLRTRIRKRLTATAHGGRLLVSAFFAGLVVAVLESACTGQVYFPLILNLIRDEAEISRGVALLLLYNVLFVLPLIAVFLAVFYGMTSEHLASFARRYTWLTKLALAAIFFAMAAWLWSTLYINDPPTVQSPAAGDRSQVTGNRQ